MSREINVVGVIGLGTMGAGIVEVFAKGGKRVIAVENTPELAERGRGFVAKSLDKAVSRGKLEQSARDEIVGRITFTHQMTDLADADLVVEAIPERMEFKRDVFGKLDEIVGEQAILASNTSSLSLTEIATHTKHPQRVVGMHFFNPAPVLALVEVITTILTDDDVVDAIRDLATELGKKPVVVGDRAGFVANALLIPYLARAIRTYETGHVTREDLDAAGRLGIGLPMGPLTLSDLIGLDVVKEVCDVLYAATKEPSVAAPALLQQMVAAGRLGRKTGRGFYAYDGSEAETSVLEFIVSDQRVQAGREEIIETLASVGFSDERQKESIGSLSGGWKMKLALARAMLFKADILLLDEPTNHLDVVNVAWLENYLTSLKTCTSSTLIFPFSISSLKADNLSQSSSRTTLLSSTTPSPTCSTSTASSSSATGVTSRPS